MTTSTPRPPAISDTERPNESLLHTSLHPNPIQWHMKYPTPPFSPIPPSTKRPASIIFTTLSHLDFSSLSFPSSTTPSRSSTIRSSRILPHSPSPVTIPPNIPTPPFPSPIFGVDFASPSQKVSSVVEVMQSSSNVL
ncbi:hypothetical protein M422DRAFT_253737 [Sphaerobolus stellatus SS14]|uniref:Uncharacterized protein n=1 Tax=Sphaerobolus stellatus (strain SS14) TaxID=990650 RepID=A0A0C9UIV9_SPHS4|nr:hypothetical protein M422DRAFT_253737 [Sphaerobolus stellatus SS14]